MTDTPIRQAIDGNLSAVHVSRQSVSRIMNRITEGKKVRRKLSIGFVLLVVAVLAAVSALAAALLWEQQVIPMKEIEQTEGDYVHWPISRKQALIRALIDCGKLEESGETAQLFADITDVAVRHAIADRLVQRLTGQADIKEISVDIITYAVMGPSDIWTPEQRVWWRQVTEQFYGIKNAPDTLVAPGKDVIPEVEAIAIAKDAILAAYALSADALDNALPVADLYVTEQRPDCRRWNVQFKLFREGSETYVERVYTAVVDGQGQVVADPDMGAAAPQTNAARPSVLQAGYPDTPLFQRIDDLAMQAGKTVFQLWPLELKAEFSQTVAPEVRAVVQTGDLTPLNNGGVTDYDVIAYSSYTYGLPGETDISREKAFALAKQAVMETFHLDSQTVALYDDCFFYFDVTNPGLPVWKIVFWSSYASAAEFPDGFASGQGHLRYKVELNAQTGEVTHTEAFEFQALGGDLAYKLKLY
jgi:hypothetical protein